MNDSIPEIPPDEANVFEAASVLIDVREPEEWDAGHAPAATHVPLSVITPEAVPSDVAVLCICRSGGRSARAAAMLRAAGIDAINVAGGMNAWAAAGLPVVQPDGTPGTVI